MDAAECPIGQSPQHRIVQSQMSLVPRMGNPVLSFRLPLALAWITTYLPSRRRLSPLPYLPTAIRLLLSQTHLFSTYIKSCLPLLKSPCPTCGEIFFFLTTVPWVLPALPISPHCSSLRCSNSPGAPASWALHGGFSDQLLHPLTSHV